MNVAIRKKISFIFIMSLLLVLMLSISGTTAYASMYPWDGSGTSEDPFVIRSEEDFIELSNNTTYWYSSFIQVADIDLTGVSSWKPIGSSSGFGGTFNGNGFVIRNLQLLDYVAEDEAQYYFGLFGYLERGSKLKNISIENFNLSVTDFRYLGGLAYRLDGIMDNCHIVNSSLDAVNDNLASGGLVGVNGTSGIIRNSYSDCIVNGEKSVHIGGLVGINNGEINNCYAIGEVEGGSNETLSNIGGLVGSNAFGIVSCSYAEANVTSEYWAYMGGLVGTNSNGTITKSYAMSEVTGGGFSALGGLVGVAGIEGTVSYSYAISEVTGGANSVVGGLVGSNDVNNDVISSYAAGTVTGGSNAKIGGLIGDNFGNVTSSYFDKETTGQEDMDIANGIAETTENMMLEETFEGWDFIDIWQIKDDKYYPILGWEPTPADWISPWEGSGTNKFPFLIQSAEDLIALGNEENIVHMNAKFVVTEDIDLSVETNFTPIGRGYHPFTGSFDGNGFTISNLTINSSEASEIGLFGYVYDGCELMNIKLVDVNVVGSASLYLGALVGYVNEGVTITNCSAIGNLVGGSLSPIGGLVGVNHGGVLNNCFASGTVTGGDNAKLGGLAGINRSSGSINESYADVDVFCGNVVQAGGLVGFNYNYAIISNCFATGLVTGGNSSCIGGLVGENRSIVNNCYATGSVDTLDLESIYITGLIGVNDGYGVTSSYYDKDTTGYYDDDISKGKSQTTEEMKKQETFAGWDFDDIWKIKEDEFYPILQWQPTPVEWLTGAIAGIVNDIEGTPIEGVKVSLSVGEIEYTAYTAADGSYIIRRVPAGTEYTVTAFKLGYIDKSISEISVSEEITTIGVDITLTSDQEGCLVTYRGAQKRFNDATNTYDLRFIATIDTLNAYEVGFVFSKTQPIPTRDNSAVKATRTVYTSITAAGSTVTAEELGGEYIIACTVTGIPESDIDTTLYVRAFSTVDGATRYTEVATVKVSTLP